MLEHLKKATNVTYTENGAIAHKTTLNHLVDLFAQAGAMRKRSEEDIVRLFMRAYHENPDLAMKALFYFRDCRGGAGERRFFRVVTRHLANSPYKQSLIKNLEYISEFGRWDDLIELVNTPVSRHVVEILARQLADDLTNYNNGKPISLLAKWAPSENASSKKSRRLAYKLQRKMGLTEREYRKMLSALRNHIDIVETKMSANRWSEIEYDKLPSRAGLIYRNAFYRHDPERYSEYIKSLSEGKAKVNASVLYPYEILREFGTRMEAIHPRKYNAVFGHAQNEEYLNSLWKNLPDYIGDNDENAIAVIDTSGSMIGLPICVAVSLGLYFAERNKGKFANHFITFSKEPQLVEIVGNTLGEKIRYMTSFNWGMNTDIEAVFDLILDTAIKNHLPQEEMPSRIFIISDMEFDSAATKNDKTLFQTIRKKYEDAGYKLPTLVFWQVDARNEQFPVKISDEGVQLVSGMSPSLFTDLLAGKDLSPEQLVLNILTKERYAKITA